MKGYCDNPKSYYFGEVVDSDFEPEECGLRKCGSCPYFYVPENDPVIQQGEYLLNELKKVRAEIKAVEKAIKEAESEEEKQYLEEILEELRKKEEQLEEQIREFRREREMSERVFPFF